MERKDELLRVFSGSLRAILKRFGADFGKMQEIRLRAGLPLMVVWDNHPCFLSDDGQMSDGPAGAHRVSAEEVRETLELVGNHSLYAFEEEIRQGFITIPGGHRVGLAGRAVTEDGEIRTIKNISFLNIRLAHQVKGCADRIMPFLTEGGQVFHTLVISPPGCGKTTLLRDMIRQLAGGGARTAEAPRFAGDRNPEGGSRERTGVRNFRERPENGRFRRMNIGVIDERSELAACSQGIPQNDLGISTDVMDCCPKAEGMMMMIRTMSPDVIAVDEIGSRRDLEAMGYVMNCGCRILATVHGDTVEDVACKPVLGEMVRGRMFERYIVLSRRMGAGTVEEVRSGGGEVLYTRGGAPEREQTGGKGGGV